MIKYTTPNQMSEKKGFGSDIAVTLCSYLSKDDRKWNLLFNQNLVQKILENIVNGKLDDGIS